MSKQQVYYGGWWIDVEFEYYFEKGNLYGPMEDCFPDYEEFDYEIISYGKDDEEPSCPEDELKEVLKDSEVIQGLISFDPDYGYDEDYDENYEEEDYEY